jgi:hypothetical protein
MGNHQTIPNDLVCGLSHFKRANYPPTTVVKLNLIIYIYMYTVTIKRIFNKVLHIVPFWKSMLNVFLSR